MTSRRSNNPFPTNPNKKRLEGATVFASTTDNARTMTNLTLSVALIGCDLHVLNLDLNHSIESLLGPKGDMNTIHLLQLAYKISYICSHNWTETRALLKKKINQIISTKPKAEQKICRKKWKV